MPCRPQHRCLTAMAALAVLWVAGCSDRPEAADDPDDARPSTTVAATSSTDAPTTTVPRSTTSALPPCSTTGIGSLTVGPAEWLPAEVPAGWRLDSAATVLGASLPAWPDSTQFVVLDGDTVAGTLVMGTGARPLDGSVSEPVTVRGAAGRWGQVGGRSVQAANPFLTWREDGVDYWLTSSGLDRAVLLDRLAPVELSADPVRLSDPTGRLVQVAERPAEPASTPVVLSYEVPGGTATSPLGGGVLSNGGGRTDRVLVLIEQFAPGGSGILVDSTGSLAEPVGWRLDTLDGRPVLRTPDDAAIPVLAGASRVADGPADDIAMSVIGSPSATDAATVLSAVTHVDPSDARLATARIDLGGPGEIDAPACLPDPG